MQAILGSDINSFIAVSSSSFIAWGLKQALSTRTGRRRTRDYLTSNSLDFLRKPLFSTYR